MSQTTTIITGPDAGMKFYGAGSLRAARALAKNRGRRFILKFTINGTTTYSVWNADGTTLATY